MERAFKILPNSDFGKRMNTYRENRKAQREFVSNYFKGKDIETKEFCLSGYGFINKSFKDCDKGDITLYIVPTESDLEKFGKMLKKPIEYKMQGFKKNSAIMKEFANRCVEEKIIVNIYAPSARDYLNLGFQAYSYSTFNCEEGFFVKIDSDQLKENDNPEGFEGIKLSEFYKLIEKYEV